MSIKVFNTTSKDTHSHDWSYGDKFTSFEVGFVSDRHRHIVIDCVAIPISRGGHKHIITGRK